MRGYDIHAEERRRKWFDHYVSLGQYAAAQRMAGTEAVPAHAPPPLVRATGAPQQQRLLSSADYVPKLDPRVAAIVLQRAVRGEQARATVLWLKEERKHRAWLQYCVLTGQLDAAAGLGFYHELAATTIQRAFRRMIVASSGYEVGCPTCGAPFVLRRVPEAREKLRCPRCPARFEVEVAQQAWWKAPLMVERAEPEAALAEPRERLLPPPYKPAKLKRTERARRAWIGFYLARGQLPLANRLGFQHDRMALRIQRAYKAFKHGRWAVYEAERAEAALRKAVEEAKAASAARARGAAVVLQRALRRQRLHNLARRRRLGELAARLFGRKRDALVARFGRRLIERSFARASRQHEAARCIQHTFHTLEARRAHAMRREATARRLGDAARVIQRTYVRFRLRALEQYARGFLGKRSRKGSWQVRFFYMHRGHLCYLPGRALPQPKPPAAIKKALIKWEQYGEPPKKALRMSDIQTLIADPTQLTLELRLRSREVRTFRASSEHELLLWGRIFEKYTRYTRQ